MRKKSHISLSRYLVENMDKKDLYKHRRAFYIGSILPDCVPSFITRRHCIEQTFDILKREMGKLIDDYDNDKGINSYYCRKLGVITHYVADYFTFPHNSIFTGSMAEHCHYENELKFGLREYVKKDEAIRVREEEHVCRTVDDICKYIMRAHDEYLHAKKEIQGDIEYIVALCHKVADYILQVLEFHMEGNNVAAIA